MTETVHIQCPRFNISNSFLQIRHMASYITSTIKTVSSAIRIYHRRPYPATLNKLATQILLSKTIDISFRFLHYSTAINWNCTCLGGFRLLQHFLFWFWYLLSDSSLSIGLSSSLSAFYTVATARAWPAGTPGSTATVCSLSVHYILHQSINK